MSTPKDRVGKTLRKCHRMLREYYRLASGGEWAEQAELAALIKEVEKTILYREQPCVNPRSKTD